jgi:hypothetical protein
LGGSGLFHFSLFACPTRLNRKSNQTNNRRPETMQDLSNPQSSIGAVLLAIGRLCSDVTVVSDALSAHLRRCASEPELHRFLSRLQLHLGELRHAVMQPEAHTLERLREAIADVAKP